MLPRVLEHHDPIWSKIPGNDKNPPTANQIRARICDKWIIDFPVRRTRMDVFCFLFEADMIVVFLLTGNDETDEGE